MALLKSSHFDSLWVALVPLRQAPPEIWSQGMCCHHSDFDLIVGVRRFVDSNWPQNYAAPLFSTSLCQIAQGVK